MFWIEKKGGKTLFGSVVNLYPLVLKISYPLMEFIKLDFPEPLWPTTARVISVSCQRSSLSFISFCVSFIPCSLIVSVTSLKCFFK